jgi:hypothetical protein
MMEFQDKVDRTVNELINGKTLSITDTNVRKAVQTKLRDIKKNCTIVLSQLNGK